MSDDDPGRTAPAAAPQSPLDRLAACDERLLQQCRALQQLATQGTDANTPQAAAAVMRHFDTETTLHHQDEEQDLFPALLESMAGSDAVCLRELSAALGAEHRLLQARWRALRPALARIAAGSAGALAPDAVQALVDGTTQHIARETAELLPMAARLLDAAALERIGRAMHARHGDIEALPERAAVLQWRQARRRQLLAARLALDAGFRRRSVAAMAAHLDAALGEVAGQVVGVYWPFRGEPNLRRWMEGLDARGARCALPVVLRPQAPLRFRHWQPGAPLVAGVWNIPVPAQGDELRPDIVVAPVLGFDAAGFRLGYGGGFYDRTLAELRPGALVIGIGFSSAALPTIHPLAHDIPMRAIVTEQGCRWC